MDSSPPPFQPGFFRGPTHHFRVRIYFEDTDLSGIVYHANYIRFMERARSDMLRLAGIDQRTAMESGEGADQDFTLAYVVRAVTPGTYVHPAANVEDMYRPQYSARTATGMMEVKAE